MSWNHFRERIETLDELTALVGSPSELVIKKELKELDPHMQAFVARSPLLLLGTVDRAGRCDVSPRGDLSAVAKVIDPQTLVIAERPGNRRADSLRNIIETGRAGLLLLVPGVGETLRVNGRACVFRDSGILESLTIQGKQPLAAIGIHVEEAYFQCAKALLRSKIWQRSAEETAAGEFDFAQVLIDQTCITDHSADSLRAQIDTSYRERLY